MAARCYQFGFHDIELFKEDTLGTGSYGDVCKARCDGLLCAAKVMHPTLFDQHDPGTVSYLRRFEEECHLLSSAQHPNVVQYLGTCADPDTHLLVLLMELCDENLCRFLERSPATLSYHIQVNIAHDISLALVYLHRNHLIHGDLTGNNVLMIAGGRAKVTDFGMSKLASVNPRSLPMTRNSQYMSPEALEEPPSYTDKLDVFSFGVILVQIMTRQFPNPGSRFRLIDFPEGTVRMAVPETERRASHLQLIADTHQLKAIAINCLKCKEIQRPSARQVSATLCELKQTPEYAESLQLAQSVVEGEHGLRSQIRDLQHQVHTQREEFTAREQEVVDQNERDVEKLRVKIDGMEAQIQQVKQQLQGQRVLTEAKAREVVQLQSAVEGEHSLRSHIRDLQRQVHTQREKVTAREKELSEVVDQNESDVENLRVEIDRMEAQIQQLEQQLQGQRVLTEAKIVEVVQLRSTVRGKERELQDKNHIVRTGEQLVTQLRQTVREKDRTISDLQQALSACRGKSEQLRQQEGASNGHTHPLSSDLLVMSDTASASTSHKNIGRLRWMDGKEAPETMRRGSAVVDGNTLYINPGGSDKMYSCRITSIDQQWSILPDIEFFAPSLAIIDGTLTSVGGKQCFFSSECTNFLLGLTGVRGRMNWSTVFPPMPTARSSTISITTQQSLIVAGGYDGGNVLDTVEVMDIPTKQWTVTSRLPHPFGAISGTVHEGVLYLAGGLVGLSESSKSVLTCSVSDLLTRSQNKLRSLFLTNKAGVWRQMQDLPVAGSTLVTFGSHLLAIGGEANARGTAPVHCYNTHADSWHVVSEMQSTRYRCLAAVIPGERLFVVGGWDKDSVEIGSLE